MECTKGLIISGIEVKEPLVWWGGTDLLFVGSFSGGPKKLFYQISKEVYSLEPEQLFMLNVVEPLETLENISCIEVYHYLLSDITEEEVDELIGNEITLYEIMSKPNSKKLVIDDLGCVFSFDKFKFEDLPEKLKIRSDVYLTGLIN